MKRFVVLLLLVGAYAIGFGQDGGFYYWYKGEKQSLQLNLRKTFLLLDYQMNEERLSEKLQTNRANIEPVREVKSRLSYRQSRTRIQNSSWTVVKSAPETLDLSIPEVLYHAPFFEAENGVEVGLSHLFYVRLHPGQGAEQLEALANQHQVA